MAKRHSRWLAGLAILGAVAVVSFVIALQLPGLQHGSPVAQRPADRNAMPFDEAKVRAFAASQSIPLPPTLRVMVPASAVPTPVAGYLGAWGGDQGWNANGRRIILVIESIDESGTALGVLAQGPPPASSPDRRPARYRSIAGSITDAGLAFTLADAEYTFKNTSDGLIWGRWQTPGERNNINSTITLELIH